MFGGKGKLMRPFSAQHRQISAAHLLALYKTYNWGAESGKQNVTGNGHVDLPGPSKQAPIR